MGGGPKFKSVARYPGLSEALRWDENGNASFALKAGQTLPPKIGMLCVQVAEKQRELDRLASPSLGDGTVQSVAPVKSSNPLPAPKENGTAAQTAIVVEPTVTTDQVQPAAALQPEFSHNEDYSSVRYDGKEYLPTTRAAKIIRLLDTTSQTSHPWVREKSILNELGSGERLSDTFRSLKNAGLWGTLVIGDKNGRFRLNLLLTTLPTQKTRLHQ
jgi:hypothetical protein